ncbi:MAG: hypothetical protein K9G29_08285 [Crocinitomicaceae bacterium]|nr:hypothetical protein [Crocinitomicaceae bacterium]
MGPFSAFNLSVMIQFVTGIVPLLFLLIYKRKLRVELVLLLLASATTSLILLVTCSLGIKNWFFFNLYSVINLTCLTVYYYNLLQVKTLKIVILLLASICGAVIIYELTYYDIINLSLPALFLSFTLYSILYLIDNLGKSSTPNSKGYFIINTTFFIYNGFSFFMSLELETMLANQYWIIHNVVEASSKLVIAYAILKIPKTTEEMNSKSVTLP